MKKSTYELLLRTAALFGIPLRKFTKALKNQSTNLIVLMYHDIDKEQFRNHLQFLDKHFVFIDLNELVQVVERGEFPSDLTAAITFDDGLDSFYRNAMPIVDETGIPVANYVTSGVVDSEYWYKPGQGRIFIPDKTESDSSQVILPPDRNAAKRLGFTVVPGLTSEHLLEASRHPKITIGAHSVTHRLLRETTYNECKREIFDSKKDLENLIGHEVKHFAYPGGSFSKRAVHLVQEAGFASGASAQDIWVPREVNPFSIPRKGAGPRGASLYWLQYRIGK